MPTLKNMLLGRRVIGEMLLERIPLETVPENSEEASKWLYESYRHKVCTVIIVQKNLLASFGYIYIVDAVSLFHEIKQN